MNEVEMFTVEIRPAIEDINGLEKIVYHGYDTDKDNPISEPLIRNVTISKDFQTIEFNTLTDKYEKVVDQG